MNLAPVALFVYNRLNHTEKCIESLQKNHLAKETDLYIFSDSYKGEEDFNSVSDVRNYIKKISGFKSVNIILREKNFGLANSIISGVSEVIKKAGKVIVLEDDLLSSQNFLDYMNLALNFYNNVENVFSIAGYSPPIKISKEYNFDTYLIPTRSASWGWATWENVWNNVDWEIRDYRKFCEKPDEKKIFNLMGNDMTKMLDKQMNGKINSWSIRFDYHLFRNNAYCVYPVISKIFNYGMDASGTHTGKTNLFNVKLDDGIKKDFKFQTEPDEYLIEESAKFYNSFLSFGNKLIRKINSFFIKK